jgi:hypothetical protein
MYGRWHIHSNTRVFDVIQGRPKVAEWIDSGLTADGMTWCELIATAGRQGFYAEEHRVLGKEHPQASV